ncbi:hypothetical protein EXIGLDRAFT_736670 [Exidia glandulosa HHB12029]|uniref:Uncharacterized protein n=1 Tax=Exidia glandulosa HHB12029 TaxID=1314781 RepID=A0A166N3W6_EXIGL|nr:hypothetical protein EXIGLDRAFT_736670 [Exidia glandulosa HHB12029]
MSSPYSEACLAHTNSALPSAGADGKSGSGAIAGDSAGGKMGPTGAGDGGTNGSGAGARIGAAGGGATIGAAACTPCVGPVGGAKNGGDGDDGTDAAAGSNTPCKRDPGVAIGAAATAGAAGGITIGDAACTPSTGAGGTNDPGARTGGFVGEPTTWDGAKTGAAAGAAGNNAPGAAIGIVNVNGGATGSPGAAGDPVCDGGSRLIGAGRNGPGAISGGTCDGASGGSLKEKPGSPPTTGPVGACGGEQLLKGRRIGPRRPGLTPTLVGGGAARRTGLSVSGGSSDSDSKSDSGIASRKEVVPSAHGAEGGNGRMSGRVNGMNGALGLGLIMDVGRTPARRRSSLPQRSCGNVPGASAGEAPPCSSLAEDSIGMGMATTGPKASAR